MIEGLAPLLCLDKKLATAWNIQILLICCTVFFTILFVFLTDKRPLWFLASPTTIVMSFVGYKIYEFRVCRQILKNESNDNKSHS